MGTMRAYTAVQAGWNNVARDTPRPSGVMADDHVLAAYHVGQWLARSGAARPIGARWIGADWLRWDNEAGGSEFVRWEDWFTGVPANPQPLRELPANVAATKRR